MKKYTSAAVTKTGRRVNNQDNYLLGCKCAECDHDTFTYKYESKSDVPFFAAVCDGMGGESFGERASYETCMELAGVQNILTKDFSANKTIVREAILNANTRLCDIMQEEKNGRMGSTVISVLIQNDTLFYTNLGDSRIYLLKDGKLAQITKDHTEGQSMVDIGVLTAEQLKNHPSRNKLNRHLGLFPDEMILECPVYDDVALKSGDKILLCSDGVFGVLDDGVIVSVLSEKTSPEERALKLVETAYANGSKDNMTAMVIDIEKSVSDYLPIVFGAGALCLAALLLFSVKPIFRPNSSETTLDSDSTYESPSESEENVSTVPDEESDTDSEEAEASYPDTTSESADSAESTQTVNDPDGTEILTSITEFVPESDEEPSPPQDLDSSQVSENDPSATLEPIEAHSTTEIPADTSMPEELFNINEEETR